MIRSLKAIGLSWAAMLALAALAAPAAHAKDFLTGEQIEHNGSTKHTLTTSSGYTISCTSATLPGTIDEKHEAATITPSYSGCSAKFGETVRPATVTMNGCDYLFQAGQEDEEGHFGDGTASLACPESKKTEVDIYQTEAKHVEGIAFCTLKIPPFANKSEVTFTNTAGSPSDVDLMTSIEGISVEGTGLCGGASPTATYTGATTLKGYVDEAHTKSLNLKIEETPLPVPEITGEQIEHNGSAKHTLATSSGYTISCTSATLPGSIDEKYEAVTITPDYGGCSAKVSSIVFPATITMNGCDYLFQAGKEDKEGHFEAGTANLTCPESKKIEVDIYENEAKHKEGKTLCILKVVPFSSKSEVTFTNTEGLPSDVDLTTSVKGINVERTGSALCGGPTQSGTYTGATTLRAYSNEAHTKQVDLAISRGELTGEQIEHNGGAKHTLATSSGYTISCASATLPGSIDEKHEAVTITPSYSGCTAKLGEIVLPATITMNGCDYLFQAGEENEEGHFEAGTASLTCPESKKTEVDIYEDATKHTEGKTICVFKVSPFSSKSKITFTNTAGSPDDVDLTTSLEGISVERTGSLLCGGASQTATYTGATTLRAYSNEAHTKQVDLGIE